MSENTSQYVMLTDLNAEQTDRIIEAFRGHVGFLCPTCGGEGKHVLVNLLTMTVVAERPCVTCRGLGIYPLRMNPN